MTRGDNVLIACPHCGQEHLRETLMSGNTFGATFWCDGYNDAPMLPTQALVERCAACGRFFYIEDAKELDRVPFFLAEGDKRAIPLCDDLTASDYREALDSLAIETEGGLDTERELLLRQRIQWADNGRLRGSEGSPKDEDAGWKAARSENLTLLAALADAREYHIIAAEALRELGLFNVCLERTRLAREAEGNSGALHSIAQIEERALAKEKSIFAFEAAAEASPATPREAEHAPVDLGALLDRDFPGDNGLELAFDSGGEPSPEDYARLHRAARKMLDEGERASALALLERYMQVAEGDPLQQISSQSTRAARYSTSRGRPFTDPACLFLYGHLLHVERGENERSLVHLDECMSIDPAYLDEPSGAYCSYERACTRASLGMISSALDDIEYSFAAATSPRESHGRRQDLFFALEDSDLQVLRGQARFAAAIFAALDETLEFAPLVGTEEWEEEHAKLDALLCDLIEAVGNRPGALGERDRAAITRILAYSGIGGYEGRAKELMAKMKEKQRKGGGIREI